MDAVDRMVDTLEKLPGVSGSKTNRLITISLKAYLPALRQLNQFEQVPPYSSWVAGSIVLMPDIDKDKTAAAWKGVAEELFPEQEQP